MSNPISIQESGTTPRITILSPERASRGGLIEDAVRKIDETAYFNIKPHECDTKEFLGLPYYDRPCQFKPGKEEETTREYARIDTAGNLIIHSDFIFPGQAGWLGHDWAKRVIDNKNPLADRVNFFTGFVYDKRRKSDGFVDVIDAKGKDYVILTDRNHIVPAFHIDFEGLAKLEQIFTERELRDPDIEYVSVGSNNSGLPRLIQLPFTINLDLDSLIELLRSNGVEGLEHQVKTMAALRDYAKGYYESAGVRSGASQTHPHDRVVSLPILPPWILEIYRRTEHSASQNGNGSFYDFLKNGGFLIEEGEYFGLGADPVPELNGGLLIISKKRQNIVEMSDQELRELGRMRKLGRVLQEIIYDGAPSNDYMVQTFGENCKIYPNSKFILYMVPRRDVPGFLELGTKIVGIDTDSRQLARQMIELKHYINGRIS